MLDIAQACQPDREWDYESAKRWFTTAEPAKYLHGRRAAIDLYFQNCGHSQGLSLTQRKSSGHHRAQWLFTQYDLSAEPGGDVNASDINVSDRTTVGMAVLRSDIAYEVTAPGSIKLNWLGWLLLGSGTFVTRSGRGLLWATLMLTSIAILLFCGYLFFAMSSYSRPLQTGDVILMLLLMAAAWISWRLLIRPWIWLLEDRIVLSGDLFAAFKEDPVQLDMAKDESHRYVRLVRYSAVCPVCAGNIELRYGYGPSYRRIFGCCTEVPTEHVFTFDRVTRRGQRHRGESGSDSN
ncbi:hypothetical protein LP417_01895 [Polaromonas sp. P1-6]|nr:hypothetical protein LP417_01895 [Polaromonas sp. P1-6]